MALNIQINSFVFSFLFGIFFYLLININKKYLFYSKVYVKIIISFLFIFNNVLIYFIILKKVNNGIIHPYFFLVILVGCIFGNFVYKKIFTKIKSKWYNKKAKSKEGDDY